MFYTATIKVLIEAFDEDAACDALAESLRPILKIHNSDGNLLDWGYLTEAPLPMPATKDEIESFEPSYVAAARNPGQVFTVAPFLIDRAYGGPEEGGWYYDCGHPEAPDDSEAFKTRYFTDRKEAEIALEHLQEALKPINEGRHPISSVLSEGIYRAILSDGEPRAWPEVRPHYE